MDPLGHMAQKLLAEQARSQLEAPPPYYVDDDDTDDEEEHEEASTPVKLVINAPQTVRGSNNILPASASILADASKLSQVIAVTVSKLNSLADQSADETPSRKRRALKVDLTINCGVTIIGDRNIVGNVALRPRPNPGPAPAAEAPGPATTGAKRPAEEENNEPHPKRTALGSASSSE